MTKADPNHDYDHPDDHDLSGRRTLMANPKYDPATRNDHDRADNDNERAIASAPTGGALASLAALSTALNNVDTASVVGRSGKPMLQFKRDGDGTWAFGQRRTVVEEGSRWAVNPTTFKWGLHRLQRQQ